METLVSAREQVAGMQRARLLGAAVVVLEELGWSRTTVAHITTRARVSRRTFYDLFENREDCLLAVMQDTAGRVEHELAMADLADLPWRERVRQGLWVVLCFFDRDPLLAQVCVVQSARGSRRVLECREEVFKRLASVIDEGRSQSTRAGESPPLIAEGLIGAAVSILYTRLLRDEREPLSGLLGELMAMIVLPYLGPAVARQERSRALPVLVSIDKTERQVSPGVGVGHGDVLRDVPMRLTYRTARVLHAIAENPGGSNRVVGERSGIFDPGQVSKLLARLQRLGLVQNTGRGQAKGEPNAWELTPTGIRVQCGIDTHSHLQEAVAS